MRLVGRSPHAPTDVVTDIAASTASSTDAAVVAARTAQREWAAAAPLARAAALQGAADALAKEAAELAALVCREVGKPIVEAKAEVARGVAILQYFAQQALAPTGDLAPTADRDALHFVQRRPVGVVGVITPWNFPVAIPLWKMAPALVHGNAVVWKPSPMSTGIALRVHEILRSHLPADVAQLVCGDREVGQALVTHHDVAAVTFTGSTAVGTSLASTLGTRGVRFQAEMGGNNPCVVLADADLDQAASIAARSAFGYAGQKCTAVRRVIVEASVLPAFRDRFVHEVEKLPVLDPHEETCAVGPLIDQDAVERALKAVAATDGTVLAGGRRIEHQGNYLEPTVVEVGADSDSPLVREEVFAPVVTLQSAPSADAAVEMANDTDYGLVAAVFTRELGSALSAVARLEAGLIRVNAPTVGVDFHVPFGGNKRSSLGPREQGEAARDFFTETSTVVVRP